MAGDIAATLDQDPAYWFREHFDRAAEEILQFLGGAGVSLEGKAVADIGSGDGIIDLGLAVKGRPSNLVGYDPRPTDVDALRRSARAAGVVEELPACMAFVTSETELVPSAPDSFDVVVSWSVFEHVSRPATMLAEVERILKPSGVLFLQLWPFFHSEHGGHLWPHSQERFPHLLRHDEEIRAEIRGRRGTDHTRDAVDEYDSLNRITLDDLQRALLAGGLIVTKLELLTAAVDIPPKLAHVPLSALGIGGVKLLAVPKHAGALSSSSPSGSEESS